MGPPPFASLRPLPAEAQICAGFCVKWVAWSRVSSYPISFAQLGFLLVSAPTRDQLVVYEDHPRHIEGTHRLYQV